MRPPIKRRQSRFGNHGNIRSGRRFRLVGRLRGQRHAGAGENVRMFAMFPPRVSIHYGKPIRTCPPSSDPCTIDPSPNVPTNAVVSFSFSEPAVVDSLEIIQHANGITRIEGFVGDSPASMTSIGNVFGTYGDATGWLFFPERSRDVFDFNNTIAGAYYKFVITKTSFDSGYSSYNITPLDSRDAAFGPALSAPSGVPEPSAAVPVAGLVLGACLRRVRLKRSR